MLDPTSPELLQRLRALDEQALGAVFDAYYPMIYAYSIEHTRHGAVAEDLTAEVFTRLVEQLGQERGPEQNIKAWLYRVAHNLIVDDARRQTHRQHDELDESQPMESSGVEEQAVLLIQAEQARQALQCLTVKQRSVIILRFLEGMSVNEITEIMDLPAGAVKSLQKRGVDALRRELNRVQKGSSNA